MDKISKFLKKLTAKELAILGEVIEALLAGNAANLDIKKLRGFDDIYRVRIRSLRIIYSQKGDLIKIIEISRRSEKTYKDFNTKFRTASNLTDSVQVISIFKQNAR